MFNFLKSINLTLKLSVSSVFISSLRVGMSRQSSFSTTASSLTSVIGQNQPQNIWSRRLIFPESQIQNIVNAFNEYRLSRANNSRSNLLITICCVPPRFNPAIVLIPVYEGAARDGYETFSSLFEMTPISNLPTYIHVFPL